MVLKRNLYKISIISAFVIFALALILAADIGKNGAVLGILLCGRVVIPSLFPFTVCILFIMNIISNSAKSSFSLKEKLLLIVFSLVGGYPIGAKLLNNAVKSGKISAKCAGNMLNYCINAGPAFIIGAVGTGLLSSQKLGYILFLSHILASIILALISKDKSITQKSIGNNKQEGCSFSESFVISVSESSSAILSICGYVVLFSVVSEYFKYLENFGAVFKFWGLLLEVTTALSKTQNIYLVSFLLGFTCLCVWCQIFSIGRLIKIKFHSFLLFRVLHGAISSALTFVFVKAFGITLPCISNNINFSPEAFYSSPALSLSLISMGIVLIITLFTKKYTGKILGDIV